MNILVRTSCLPAALAVTLACGEAPPPAAAPSPAESAVPARSVELSTKGEAMAVAIETALRVRNRMYSEAPLHSVAFDVAEYRIRRSKLAPQQALHYGAVWLSVGEVRAALAKSGVHVVSLEPIRSAGCIANMGGPCDMPDDLASIQVGGVYEPQPDTFRIGVSIGHGDSSGSLIVQKVQVALERRADGSFVVLDAR